MKEQTQNIRWLNLLALDLPFSTKDYLKFKKAKTPYISSLWGKSPMAIKARIEQKYKNQKLDISLVWDIGLHGNISKMTKNNFELGVFTDNNSTIRCFDNILDLEKIIIEAIKELSN